MKLAARGARNMDDGTKRIDDRRERDQLARQGRRVRRRVLVSAVLLTALSLAP